MLISSFVVKNYNKDYPNSGRPQSYTVEKRHKKPFSMPFRKGVDVNKYSFSIFKKASRPCYLVAFKDESGKFLPPVSTKKPRKPKSSRSLSNGFKTESLKSGKP
jgi:hypothetical protein